MFILVVVFILGGFFGILYLDIQGYLFIGSNDSIIDYENDIDRNSSKDIEILDNIEAFNQYPDYPTGCESVALYLLLRHYNIDVTVDDVIHALNKGPVPYGSGEILSGANPEREFVGDPYSNAAYGVFEVPIRNAANRFKSGAISKNGLSIQNLEKIIKDGSPIVAWIRTKENYDSIEYGKPWVDYQTGEKVTWIRYEHAVLVYGYSNSAIYISNPYNGEKYQIDKDIFRYNFELMGGRVVYYSK